MRDPGQVRKQRLMIALWVATAAAWFVGAAGPGRFAPTIFVAWAATPVAVTSTFAWAVERSVGGRTTPLWAWLLYTTLVASVCAWYIHVRGTVLTIELLLPTMAVLLAWIPIRTWAVERAGQREVMQRG